MTDPPKQIKFSHVYEKFAKGLFGTDVVLVSLDIVQRKDMLDSFVEYDTVYIENEKQKHYPLSSKAYMVLGFDSPHIIPRRVQITRSLSREVGFTTCRSYADWKTSTYEWYLSSIGERFKIILDEPEGVPEASTETIIGGRL
jgi:hypothetical protein